MFFPIFQLSRSNETVTLCIIFLQTISEELVSPKEELLFSRRTELRRLLLQQVPTMLTLLSGEFIQTYYLYKSTIYYLFQINL